MTDSAFAYRRRDLAFCVTGAFLFNVAVQMLSVALGWQIYALTHSTLALGLVGLCQFLPLFLLSLPAGDLSDRFDPRKILAISLVVIALCSAFFLALTFARGPAIWPYYVVLVLLGAARGFSSPAEYSLVVFLVPKEQMARALALNSSAGTIAVIAGPALGGLLYMAGAAWTYAACIPLCLAAALLSLTLGGRRATAEDREAANKGGRLERVAEGLRFVRAHPVILGAISLDLFAVLLGGAVALLPVYARDILHTGPLGLGLLRSAPAAGAALVGLWLARRPLERHAGMKMFAAVGIFGAATLVFGLSRSFFLSLAALLVLGGSDMISVFVRSTMVQFATPDFMRGRVSSVTMLFVGASNELGEFESGFTAAWFGVVPAVVIGGLGTLAVVALWMTAFPRLRRVDRLQEVTPEL